MTQTTAPDVGSLTKLEADHGRSLTPRVGILIGYARCSTERQDLTAQREILRGLGVSEDRIYLDHGLTGRNRSRPGLNSALAAAREGDTLVVPKLDRLARSVPDARAIGDSLAARGVRLSLGGSVHDPTDPMGKCFFNILATFAEFEVDLLRMRTREGMAIARAKGRLKGKAPKLSPTKRTVLLKLHAAGDHTIAELAELSQSAAPPSTANSLAPTTRPAQAIRMARACGERSPLETAGRSCDPVSMIIDRLPDDARQALVGAFREAADLGHPSVGPEHVLLGFFDEPNGSASRALTRLGVSRNRLRDHIAMVAAQHAQTATSPARRTRTLNERARRMLLDAGGLSMGEPVIRTDHLLLAMLVEPDDTATHALAILGVEPPAVRAAVARFADTD